jgi:hypothetical protein
MTNKIIGILATMVPLLALSQPVISYDDGKTFYLEADDLVYVSETPLYERSNTDIVFRDPLYSPSVSANYLPAGTEINEYCDATTLVVELADGLGGITYDRTDDAPECGGSSGGDGGDGGGGIPPVAGYCDNTPANVNCDPAVNFDPWNGQGGEVNYWIRDNKVNSMPFTTVNSSQIRAHYLQLTSGERKRDSYVEPVFRIWVSRTPGGPVLNNDTKGCEKYSTTARMYWYLAHGNDEAQEGNICDLGSTEGQLMYINAETRCYENHYQGVCNETTPNKDGKTFQYDISKRYVTY